MNVSGVLNKSISYLRHYLTAGNEHDVHPPFLFKLLTEGIYKKTDQPAFKKIEAIRKKLLKNHNEINVTDLGAGSSFDGLVKKRMISDIALKFAKSPSHCRFLYRLVSYLQPSTIVELGTSLGISTMYLAAANTNGSVYTIEGCPETAREAINNFNGNGFQDIKSITGNFDTALPILLKKLQQFDCAYIDGNHTLKATLNYFNIFKNNSGLNSVIIFDDIYWSDGMQQAWKEIKADPKVTLSVDFYQFGIVFFNTNFSKQHFILKL